VLFVYFKASASIFNLSALVNFSGFLGLSISSSTCFAISDEVGVSASRNF
jgi:hypothetical protein